MLTDTNGNKVTAKNKAKIILKAHLDGFVLSSSDGFDKFSKGEVKKVEEHVVKLTERINKVLTVK